MRFIVISWIMAIIDIHLINNAVNIEAYAMTYEDVVIDLSYNVDVAWRVSLNSLGSRQSPGRQQ